MHYGAFMEPTANEAKQIFSFYTRDMRSYLCR